MQRLVVLSFICGAALIPIRAAEPVDKARPENSERDKANRVNVSADDWPWWRGPLRNGVASPQAAPPQSWSETEHVRWRVNVPGRGHGSPTVVGDRVFLATAEMKADLQSVICYDRRSGDQLWKTVVHDSGITKKSNQKASQASSTVACDGERVFISFLSHNAIYTTALDLQGNQLWQTKIVDYKLHQGYGSSPAIYKHLVLVTADNKLGGAVAALDRLTGEIVWRHDRPKTPNYPSPIVFQIGGRPQLVLTGCNLVTSLDPLTGESLWEIEGATTECVTSTPTDGQHVFSSGGYPKNHMAAIKADGSGEVVWENNVRVYVPSMLVQGGYLYAVTDAGVAMCWKADTGEEQWKGRLGGTFSASPVLVGDRIFATNESGQTFIYRAQPDSFELLGKNQLGSEVFATPTFVRNEIFMRVAHFEGDNRQEVLYCLGK